MTETKQFDPKSTSFEANGKKYFVNTKLSIARFEQYEMIQPKLTFDVDFSGMFSGLKKIYNLLNEQRFADAAVITRNYLSAIEDVRNEKRVHPGLLMAALAINREDEDPGVFDEKIQLEKIADWRAEGYGTEGFFILALTIINGFGKEYNEFTTDPEIEKVNLRK